MSDELGVEETTSGKDLSLGPAGVMTHLPDLASMVSVQEDATVSRTVLKADGARVVLFAFDAGQVLTEHTAAMPVLLVALDGRFTINGGGTSVELIPGGLIHFDTRLPHTVVAEEPSRLALIMLDNRAKPLHDAAGIRD
ncbi:hypothetical protein SAMN05443377_107110 [Propionibacterium cyclohexanicum]|uniref:Cupin domain-containing protein n=1 Tax=Propionibacterium cyclohexanicum TaxID=64702 RepID=A0A1H9RL09_9ACTN|nr:cupin domain-containing protein [Propionibacterium cyclohexanicum]SER72629.1 hypothetical protein SAMN05443377_107110 [Propionibacterium cyclohexanicum]